MKSTRWNIYWALLLEFGVMTLCQFPNFLFSHINSKFWVYIFNDYEKLFHTGVAVGLLVLTVYALRRFKGLTWRESLQFLGFKKPDFTQIVIGLASCLPLLLYYFYRLNCGMISFNSDPSWQETLNIIVGAGFFEEAFYRGFLFRLFRQNHSFISAAVLSGLLWSFAHLTGCFSLSLSTIIIDFAVLLIVIFILSIPAALLFERGGNVIWGFMAAHLIWDLMVVHFPSNAQDTDMDIRHMGQFYIYAAFISSGLVTWALSSWLLRRNT